MKAIKKKLSSQRGASLTFALLLFLVCSVVGSVVLTAGTAAAGRMSEISEMDQRYYSVNSAAKLLIGLFERDEIRYEKKAAEPAAGDPAGSGAATFRGLCVKGSSRLERSWKVILPISQTRTTSFFRIESVSSSIF